MATKINKPTSPGRRFSTRRDFSGLSKVAPTKSLLKSLPKTGGRNHSGRITVRHIGGGHKQMYRVVDFIRRVPQVGMVRTIEYDPNRSSFIALVDYENGEVAYILAAKELKVGTKVVSGEKVKVAPGNHMMLKNIPTGIAIHNIETVAGQGGSLVKSAGGSAAILAHEGKYSVIKLPSGELRRVDYTCYATIGEVSNESHENTVFGKAGRKRWLGIRPTVRGKAMNPNTHPHGGGEGNNSIGMKYPKTPWGAPALGKRTRDKNKSNSRAIIRRRSK